MLAWHNLNDFSKKIRVPTPLEQLDSSFPVQLWIKRDDLIHHELGGNKWRKLKYNLLEYLNGDFEKIISFGGAFSNHVASLAYACHELKIPNTVYIRGDEQAAGNPTLLRAQQLGTQIEFVPRSEYKLFKEHVISDSNVYSVPEGGSNELATMGVAEMTEEINQQLESYDYLIMPVGSGGTILGSMNGIAVKAKALGILALKTTKWKFPKALTLPDQSKMPHMIMDYHWGGFAKTPPGLISFIRTFYQRYSIRLDPIYTGKMMYAVFDLCKKGFFPPGSKIVAVHTGGLQGIAGWEYLKKEKLFK